MKEKEMVTWKVTFTSAEEMDGLGTHPYMEFECKEEGKAIPLSDWRARALAELWSSGVLDPMTTTKITQEHVSWEEEFTVPLWSLFLIARTMQEEVVGRLPSSESLFH